MRQQGSHPRGYRVDAPLAQVDECLVEMAIGCLDHFGAAALLESGECKVGTAGRGGPGELIALRDELPDADDAIGTRKILNDDRLPPARTQSLGK